MEGGVVRRLLFAWVFVVMCVTWQAQAEPVPWELVSQARSLTAKAEAGTDKPTPDQKSTADSGPFHADVSLSAQGTESSSAFGSLDSDVNTTDIAMVGSGDI